MSYDHNKQTTISIAGNYFRYQQVRNDISQRDFSDAKDQPLERYTRQRYNPEHESQLSGEVALKHQFDEEHELSIEYNISSADETEDNYFINKYDFPIPDTTKDNFFISVKELEQQFTVDYTHPLGEDGNIEAGYDGLVQKIQQNFYATSFSQLTGEFTSDTNRSNLYHYLGNIHAVYATYEKEWEQFGASVGLRGEWTWLNGKQVTRNVHYKNAYFNLYPTLHLSYKLNENQELQLNYSTRVNRPDGDDLNPFPEYQDPINLYAGNPQLKPEIIYSVEAGYKLTSEVYSFVPSVYYRYKRNGFTSVTRPLNDTVLLTTIENLNADQAAGLELVLTGKIFNRININTSGNFFYNRIAAGNLGYTDTRAIFSFYGQAVLSTIIKKHTTLQLSANYRSARLTPQGKYFPTYVINAGLRQDFLKGKLSLSATVSDIFKTLRQESNLDDGFLRQTVISRRDSRIFYIGLSYRFGVTQKTKEDKLQFDNAL